jgi:hypothetical protein
LQTNNEQDQRQVGEGVKDSRETRHQWIFAGHDAIERITSLRRKNESHNIRHNALLQRGLKRLSAEQVFAAEIQY